MTIPASAIVSVNPAVVSAGGQALALNGLILTANTRVPIGSVLAFPTQAAVAAYFGANATEAALATNYFLANDNKTQTPGNLLFVQYPTAAVSAYLRGTSVAALSLSQLQAISGTLIVIIDGVTKTASALNLSAATSFSNAATIMNTALSITGVTYDSVSGAFVITSSTTGNTSLLTQATGTTAAALGLAAGTLSQGAPIGVPATNMAAILPITQNWAAFTTAFDPDGGSGNTQKMLFAVWTNGQNNRFAYLPYDTDANAIVANNQTCMGALLAASNYSGTIPIYQSQAHAAAFLGMIAAVNFGQTNGRGTFAFKSQTGLVASVTDPTVAANLKANGYNYYGAYATAAQGFNFFYPGLVSGPFSFADEYINQIWMNSRFQLALMSLLTGVPSVPYNQQGYALIKSACQDVINAALNFGAIRTGVVLSILQIAEVNNAAGVPIDPALKSQGYYLQVLDPGAGARATRSTPACNFFYCDGGAVQSIALASIDIQ